MFKIAIKNESEFNDVMSIAESMGYYNALEFKHIPQAKCLFLESDSKHIKWGHRNLDDYVDPSCKPVSINELREIAAGHRIDCEVLDMVDVSPLCKVEGV